MAKSENKDKVEKKDNLFGEMLGKIVPSELWQTATGARDELINILRQEVQKRLPSFDINHLVDEVAKKYDFEIKATISLKEKKNKS
jgi:hypothetical protein